MASISLLQVMTISSSVPKMAELEHFSSPAASKNVYVIHMSKIASSTYTKPCDAGRKNASVKRRATQEEPSLFVDRHVIRTVSPVKLTKRGVENEESWEIKEDSDSDNEFDAMNPDRVFTRPFTLVIRNDGRNCPKNVKRCESCKFSFGTLDTVLVKSTGTRSFTDNNGKQQHRQGNVYLHYLTKCLMEFDAKFTFTALRVPKRTKELLSANNIRKLVTKGCKLE